MKKICFVLALFALGACKMMGRTQSSVKDGEVATPTWTLPESMVLVYANAARACVEINGFQTDTGFQQAKKPVFLRFEAQNKTIENEPNWSLNIQVLSKGEFNEGFAPNIVPMEKIPLTMSEKTCPDKSCGQEYTFTAIANSQPLNINVKQEVIYGGYRVRFDSVMGASTANIRNVACNLVYKKLELEKPVGLEDDTLEEMLKKFKVDTEAELEKVLKEIRSGSYLNNPAVVTASTVQPEYSKFYNAAYGAELARRIHTFKAYGRVPCGSEGSTQGLCYACVGQLLATYFDAIKKVPWSESFSELNVPPDYPAKYFAKFQNSIHGSAFKMRRVWEPSHPTKIDLTKIPDGSIVVWNQCSKRTAGHIVIAWTPDKGPERGIKQGCSDYCDPIEHMCESYNSLLAVMVPTK